MTRKLTILTFNFLIICFNATAQLTNEETNQIRQILIEESNDKWIIGILIGGITIGVGILTTLALVIYHNTRDVANKVSDVRDMKKDMEIAMSKQLEKWDVIQSTVSNELEEMKKISTSVSEDKELISTVSKTIEERVNQFVQIHSGLEDLSNHTLQTYKDTLKALDELKQQIAQEKNQKSQES